MASTQFRESSNGRPEFTGWFRLPRAGLVAAEPAKPGLSARATARATTRDKRAYRREERSRMLILISQRLARRRTVSRCCWGSKGGLSRRRSVRVCNAPTALGRSRDVAGRHHSVCHVEYKPRFSGRQKKTRRPNPGESAQAAALNHPAPVVPVARRFSHHERGIEETGGK